MNSIFQTVKLLELISRFQLNEVKQSNKGETTRASQVDLLGVPVRSQITNEGDKTGKTTKTSR